MKPHEFMTDVTLPGIKMAWFTQDGEHCIVKSSVSINISDAYKVAELMQTSLHVLNV